MLLALARAPSLHPAIYYDAFSKTCRQHVSPSLGLGLVDAAGLLQKEERRDDDVLDLDCAGRKDEGGRRPCWPRVDEGRCERRDGSSRVVSCQLMGSAMRGARSIES